MRPRPAPVAAGAALLVLSLATAPAGAASGEVAVYDRSSLEQTISDPPAGRCIAVGSHRVPRLVNETNARVEAHTTGRCGRRPADVVSPGQGVEVLGLRAIRARS